MPLSKAKQAEWMREYRKRVKTRYNVIPTVTPDVIPWYNPQVHKAGDSVRVSVRGRVQVMVVPELDADGHMIPT